MTPTISWNASVLAAEAEEGLLEPNFRVETPSQVEEEARMQKKAISRFQEQSHLRLDLVVQAVLPMALTVPMGPPRPTLADLSLRTLEAVLLTAQEWPVVQPTALEMLHQTVPLVAR
jgi:hypothetical protein